MEMRIKMYRTRRRRELLTGILGQPSIGLTCKACGKPGQYVLWEGGLCKDCYQPKPINRKYTATPLQRDIDPRIQTLETLALVERFNRAMGDFGTSSVQVFAKALGLTSSNVYKWHRGHYGVRGQKNMHRRISAALNEWDKQNQQPEAHYA